MERSPSPGLAPVRLSDCIEPLLVSTLSSQLGDGPLDVDLVLSLDYCSGLLRPDPVAFRPDLDDGRQGFPKYPLYKRLAQVIEQCICFGTVLTTPNQGMEALVDESWKLKEDEWSNLVLNIGSELVKMLEAVEFELHVQEPFFTQLRAGTKTVEGRCAVGNYNRISPGSLLLFNKMLLLEVQQVNRYSSFFEMLQVETLAKVLPGVKTIEEGVRIYRRFYTEEKERTNGVLAISVSKPASQPYSHMASLLNGLGFDGVSYLLGMRHTAGTVPDALPPPISVLVSSAVEVHRPDVKGSSLTNAARALAKHVERSSDGWWGSLSGNDSNKNRVASEVIDRLLTNCSWMNVHLIQPYECVFEIRVPEGYGARWSKDGLKFIGFLEPYMKAIQTVGSIRATQ